MPLGVQVKGLKEFRRALNQLDSKREWQAEFRKAGLEAGGAIAEEARGRAPTATGALRSSVRPGSTATRAYVAAGNSAVLYAGVLEWGWPKHNITPQPFLVPAVARRLDQAASYYLDAVNRLMKKAFPN